MKIQTKFGIADFISQTQDVVICQIDGVEKRLMKAFCSFSNEDGTELDFSTLVDAPKKEYTSIVISENATGKLTNVKKKMKLADIMAGINELNGNDSKTYCPVRKEYI